MKCPHCKNNLYIRPTKVSRPQPITDKKRQRITEYIDKDWSSARIADKVGVTTSQVAAIKAWHNNPNSWAR